MTSPEDILQFWLKDCTPDQWYRHDPDLDAAIKARFEAAWHAAMSGNLQGWTTTPNGTLALIILTDQFSRNMFRGSAQAFASDPLAKATAIKAIDRKFDLQVAEPERQFFYMPLEHSECLGDQERAVRMMATRMSGENGLLHARVHREIIREFGRFPYRNDVLGRTSTDAEKAFIENNGYMSLVQKLQPKAA